MTVHWIVQNGALTSASKPTEIDLSVRLTGPYADISSLKQRGEKGTASTAQDAPKRLSSVEASSAELDRVMPVVTRVARRFGAPLRYTTVQRPHLAALGEPSCPVRNR